MNTSEFVATLKDLAETELIIRNAIDLREFGEDDGGIEIDENFNLDFELSEFREELSNSLGGDPAQVAKILRLVETLQELFGHLVAR